MDLNGGEPRLDELAYANAIWRPPGHRSLERNPLPIRIRQALNKKMENWAHRLLHRANAVPMLNPEDTVSQELPTDTPIKACPSAETASPLSRWIGQHLTEFFAAEPRLEAILQTQSFTAASTNPWEVRITSAYRVASHLLEPRPKAVVVFGWLKRGGAEYEGACLVAEAQKRFGIEHVLVIIQDRDVVEAVDWLHPNTRLLNMPRVAHWLTVEEQRVLLRNYLLSVAPPVIANCNSDALWEIYAEDAERLGALSRLYAFVFCFEHTRSGAIMGYAASHLHRCVDYLDVVLLDNAWFAKELEERLGYPPAWLDKLAVFYQPMQGPSLRPRLAPAPAEGERPTVLWASRICIQKRPDLLIEIAAACPEMNFEVYGDFFADGGPFSDSSIFEGQQNLRYCGSLTMIQDLDASGYHAFLYTSAWDGLPNIVPAAARMGLPIVASLVGGLADFLNNDVAWPISDIDDPFAYRDALREAVADRDLAEVKAAALFQLLRGRHSEAAYTAQVDALRLFDV